MSSFKSTENKDFEFSQEIPISNSQSSLSPQRPPPTYGRDGRKERRNPSVTPRKFTKFFTPRSQASTNPTSARQVLNDITAPSNNQRGGLSSPIRFTSRSRIEKEDHPSTFPRDLKRRKLLHTPEPTPEHTYEDAKGHGFELLQDEDEDENDLQNIQSSPCERAARLDEIEEEEEEEYDDEDAYQEPVKRIVPIDQRGLGGKLLQSMSGLPTRNGRQHLVYPANDYQDETSSFYSRPTDVHMCTGLTGPHRVIPFCAAGCNTNSLVAIGDEEGRVRLLESAKDERPPFSQVYLGFRVHTNAIIDMVFSHDDKLLATASGDQSARVVDMASQTTVAILDNHSASLKQVRFQPGSNNNSVLATSSRDGSIQIWDLRCKGNSGPRQSWNATERTGPVTRSGRVPTYGRAIHSIYGAHRQADRTALNTLSPPGPDTPGHGEVAGRIGDVSITAMSFLPEGNEHLLLTASEADTSVILWDLRSLHSKTNRKAQVAISRTRQPESHNQWRHFGVNSINVSGDGSRLYALCKDNTVYAYSISHLILGHAPELSLDSPGRRLPPQETKEGLGPMYGFRHTKLHATSFYVKSALRKAKDGQSELLACGSSDGCAILFPTDERYLPKHEGRDQPDSTTSVPMFTRRPGLTRAGSGVGISSRVDEKIPISTKGTPLIRGHDREVGSLTWTAGGELVTVGDDFIIRCWREGEDARDLRTGGEVEGRRWACGWADVSEKYDEDDD